MTDKICDNRMQWVLHLEECKDAKDGKVYFSEYEICSEVRIPGRLEYENGALQCYLLEERDKNGLYTYAIRVKHVEKKFEFNESAYSRKGYFFKHGLIGELLALFSVYFQARFYLKATVMEFDSNGHRFRTANDFNYKRPHSFSNFEMFSNQKRNWAHPDGLMSFLNTIRKINQKYHQGLIRAFHWYAEAIKEIGSDGQLFFIKMVSAVESLLAFTKIPQDSLSRKLEGLISQRLFDKNEEGAIRQWLESRLIRRRFAYFLSKYSYGFFAGGKRKAKHCHIFKAELKRYANCIYDARSAYLHNGSPMYLSQNAHAKYDKSWDLDASVGMMADRKKFAANEKLPRSRWFERIVSHCFSNFLQSVTRIHPQDR
ncbi:MAG: hypothetical protein WC547_05970 [Candidatus Omnitrophota bacterium]